MFRGLHWARLLTFDAQSLRLNHPPAVLLWPQLAKWPKHQRRPGLAIFGLLGLLGLLGCSREVPTPQGAFYYWRTHLALSAAEWQYLRATGAKQLYVKFFDVDWPPEQNQPLPQASLRVDSATAQRLRNLAVVPCVFLTVRTLENLTTAAELADLASQVVMKIQNLQRAFGPHRWSEWQFDCDWTPSTRERYFAFLRQVQAQAGPNIRLSATIRLHQYADPAQTGVPPVARGMLMLYNFGSVEDWHEEQAIFRANNGLPYLQRRTAYPLPLDLAIPAFKWAVLFRGGTMIRLINDLAATTLVADNRFSALAPNRFRVNRSTYFEGYYLYAGDLLRTEACDRLQLDTAARWCREWFPPNSRHIAIFHLTPSLTHELPPHDLARIFAQTAP